MQAKRPISIYILLAILALAILSNTFLFLRDLLRATEVEPSFATFLWVYSVARFILGIALLSFCFWAMYKRKPIGRWVGVILILLIFVGATYSQFFASKAGRVIQPMEYQSPTLGNQIEFFLRALIFGYWAFALGFSRKARLYYDENYLVKLEQDKVQREEQEKSEMTSR